MFQKDYMLPLPESVDRKLMIATGDKKTNKKATAYQKTTTEQNPGLKEKQNQPPALLAGHVTLLICRAASCVGCISFVMRHL